MEIHNNFNLHCFASNVTGDIIVFIYGLRSLQSLCMQRWVKPERDKYKSQRTKMKTMKRTQIYRIDLLCSGMYLMDAPHVNNISIQKREKNSEQHTKSLLQLRSNGKFFHFDFMMFSLSSLCTLYVRVRQMIFSLRSNNELQ